MSIMDTAPRNLFFYELCRLCLVNEGGCHMFENNLAEDILACTAVKVSPSDNLPQKICVQCSEIVRSWKDLKLLATKNDEHLHALFGNTQSHDESESQDILQIPSCPTPETPSKPEISNNLNNQSSSKQKLCLLLEAGEEPDNEVTPVIRQTISLRKDLFLPSSESRTPNKESQKENKLLKVKVEAENRCKKVKMDNIEETDNICAICSKGFHTYKKLYLHMRLHDKKICCPLDVCGKKFATKGDLQKHLRTHTGEKPYLCNICDKGFTQRVSLRSHLTTVHSDLKTSKEED